MVAKDKIGRAKKDMKTLGTVRGFTPWDYLDDVQKAKTIRLVENDSLAGLLQQAKQGRVDGIYVNISVANYALKSTLKEPEALVFDKALPHTASTYKLSSLKHEAVLKKLNAYVAEKKPAIEKMRAKWGL